MSCLSRCAHCPNRDCRTELWKSTDGSNGRKKRTEIRIMSCMSYRAMKLLLSRSSVVPNCQRSASYIGWLSVMGTYGSRSRCLMRFYSQRLLLGTLVLYLNDPVFGWVFQNFVLGSGNCESPSGRCTMKRPDNEFRRHIRTPNRSRFV